jgi:3-deoxy-7-phosphoheptulonate synthase
MIVAMQERATDEQIYAVIEAMEEAGVDVHRTTGASQTILAAVGSTASLELSKFEVLPGVLHVHRISAPYKLAGRAFRPEGTVVEFSNGAKIGGERVAIIAGPCAIENREQIFTIAECVKGAGGQFLRGGAFQTAQFAILISGDGHSGAATNVRSCASEWSRHGDRGDGDFADRADALVYRLLPGGREEHAEL